MLILFGIGIAVGAFGALLGLGGGILLIPLITMFLGVPIKTAIGTSILCVVATSSAAGAVYVGRGLTHNRLAMVLEVATTAGALAGGITAVLIRPNLLALFFGLILIYAAFNMRKLPKEDKPITATGVLDTSYVDPLTGNNVRYGIRKLAAGMGASFCRQYIRPAWNWRRDYQSPYHEHGHGRSSARCDRDEQFHDRDNGGDQRHHLLLSGPYRSQHSGSDCARCFCRRANRHATRRPGEE